MLGLNSSAQTPIPGALVAHNQGDVEIKRESNGGV